MKFLFLFLFISLNASAEVTFQWLGITGFSLTDGKTTLLFDPVITRPTIMDILFRRAIKSDPKLVEDWIHKASLKKVDATFITHAHHDHSLDMPEFVKRLGGHVYGSTSTIKIAQSFGIKEDELKVIKIDEVIQVGDFKITVMDNPHSPVLGPLYFAKGDIENKLSNESNVFDYKMGDSFGYYIEHPEGKILFQSTANYPKKLEDKNHKADVMLFCVATTTKNGNLISSLLDYIQPKKIIPLHFDNFLKPVTNDEVEYFYLVDMEEFSKLVRKNSASVKIIEPKYHQVIRLY